MGGRTTDMRLREWKRQIDRRTMLKKKTAISTSTRECETGEKVLPTCGKVGLENSSVLSSGFLSLE